MNMTARKILRVFAVLACLLMAGVLSACDQNKNAPRKIIKENTVTRALYLVDFAFDDEGTVGYATVAFKGEEEQKLESTLLWKSVTYADGAMYNAEDVEMTVNSSELFYEVDNRTREDKDNRNYGLKVKLRYDTIYKSIKSDAEIAKDGRTYSHYFRVEEDAPSVTFGLHLKNPNSAGWYSVLIASVLAFGIVLTVVIYAVKKKRKAQNIALDNEKNTIV